MAGETKRGGALRRSFHRLLCLSKRRSRKPIPMADVAASTAPDQSHGLLSRIPQRLSQRKQREMATEQPPSAELKPDQSSLLSRSESSLSASKIPVAVPPPAPERQALLFTEDKSIVPIEDESPPPELAQMACETSTVTFAAPPGPVKTSPAEEKQRGGGSGLLLRRSEEPLYRPAAEEPPPAYEPLPLPAKPAPSLVALGLYFPGEQRHVCAKLLLLLYSLAVFTLLVTNAARIGLGLQAHLKEATAQVVPLASRLLPFLHAPLLFFFATTALLSSSVLEFDWQRCRGWLVWLTVAVGAKIAAELRLFDSELEGRKLGLLPKIALHPLEDSKIRSQEDEVLWAHGLSLGLAVVHSVVPLVYVLGALSALETKTLQLTAFLRSQIRRGAPLKSFQFTEIHVRLSDLFQADGALEEMAWPLLLLGYLLALCDAAAQLALLHQQPVGTASPLQLLLTAASLCLHLSVVYALCARCDDVRRGFERLSRLAHGLPATGSSTSVGQKEDVLLLCARLRQPFPVAARNALRLARTLFYKTLLGLGLGLLLLSPLLRNPPPVAWQAESPLRVSFFRGSSSSPSFLASQRKRFPRAVGLCSRGGRKRLAGAASPSFADVVAQLLKRARQWLAQL